MAESLMQESDRVMTVAEAAEFVGLAYSTLAQAMREGRVKGWRSGSTWLVTVAALRQAIDEGSIRPPKKL